MNRTLVIPVLIFAACATNDASMHAPSGAPEAAAQTACPAASAAALNATLWMQTSAEYQAITREVYRTARGQLDLALADPAWSALPDLAADPSRPPAIILDLDETALDTSAFQARQTRSGSSYSDQAWKRFSAAGNARAIAAALDFLRYAAGRGVEVFYLTNRAAAEEPSLRQNLTALGFPIDEKIDTVLARNERPEWTSDKSSRRAFVGGNYRVLLLFGDDLNDFVAAAGKSIAERNDLLHRFDSLWGTRWFVLPNAMYGSWERAVVGNVAGDCAQLQKKIDTLRTDDEYRP